MAPLKKALLLGTGFISLALGAIGIFLPILPTVPFLLLTSFCFMKGSSHFDSWFKGTSLYQKYVGDYLSRGGMTLKSKASILLFFTSLIAIPFFMVPNGLMRAGLLIIVAAKYYFFAFRVKTLSRKDRVV